MSSSFTRGELAELQAGVYTPEYVITTFDGTGNNGKVSTASTLTTALTGTNNDMVFTADTAGIAGDLITIEYNVTNRAPGHSSAECHTSGNAITVDLKTSAGVAATSTITGSDAANAIDGKVVVIGTTTYRLKSTMAQAYDVQIGASADATLGNLIKAINASGTPGTEYFAGTLIHPTVTAGALAAHAFVITAKTIGAAGNSIATTTDETTYSWTSTVMAGGEDLNQVLSTAAEVKTAIEANTAAAALVDIANSGADDGSGVVTVMAATALAGGSDGTVTLFTAEDDGLIAILGDCTADLTGNTATLEVGVTGNTAALIPQTTATTLDSKERIDRSGVIATTVAPNVTPFFPVRTGDVIKVTVGTASITGGSVKWQMYFRAFNGSTSGGTGTSAQQIQGTAADNAAAVGNPVLTGAKYNATPPTYADGDVANNQADVNGNLKVNIAAGGSGVVDQSTFTSASSTEQIVGGVYQSTPDTIANGKTAAIGIDSSRNVKVTLATGLDSTNDSITTYPGGHSYTTISTATTTTIKSGAGVLRELTVTGGTAGTIVVYDNTAGSGTKIADFDSTNALASYLRDVAFTTGLTIVTGDASKLTVVWR